MSFPKTKQKNPGIRGHAQQQFADFKFSPVCARIFQRRRVTSSSAAAARHKRAAANYRILRAEPDLAFIMLYKRI